jgi:hypothetical protein
MLWKIEGLQIISKCRLYELVHIVSPREEWMVVVDGGEHSRGHRTLYEAAMVAEHAKELDELRELLQC